MKWVTGKEPEDTKKVIVRIKFRDGNTEVGTGRYYPRGNFWKVMDQDDGEFTVANGYTFASVTGWQPMPAYGDD